MGASASKLEKVLVDPTDKAALDKLFMLYDANKDGQLQKEEVVKFARDIFKYIGVKYGQEYIMLYLPREVGVALGKCKDWKKNMGDYHFEGIADILMEIFDTDKSGGISIEEWKNYNWEEFDFQKMMAVGRLW